MNYKRVFVLSAALLAAAALIAAAGPPGADAPRFNAKGELLFPANYREWVFLSSGLGMTYDAPPDKAPQDPNFDNVFAAPSAYKGFLENGRWPDHTLLVIEVRGSMSKGSINKSGHFQTDLLGIEAEVKDESRFPGKWAFFNLEKGVPAGKQRPTTDSCYSCHAEHGAVDHTFVQFYPTLISVAKEKGTLK